MRFLRVVFCLSLVAAAAQAQPFDRTFVSFSGIDTNNCSKTTPCRNFSGAILKTNPGGEIIALDSAGYGASLVIDRSIRIIVPEGIYGGMTGVSGTTILVDAPSGEVTLQGIQLNSQGGFTGIDVADFAPTVHFDKVSVEGYSSHGILVSANGAKVYLREVTVQNCGANGFFFANGASALVDHSFFKNNFEGLVVDNGAVAVRDSYAANNDNSGFFARGFGASQTAIVTCDGCTSTANGQHGFHAGGSAGAGQLTVQRSTALKNSGAGVQSSNNGTLRMLDNVIISNGIGVAQSGNGILQTNSRNTVMGNTTPHSPADTLSMQGVQTY